MAFKAILILCAQALLVKFALGQCSSRAAIAAASGLTAPALAGPLGWAAPGFTGCGLDTSGLTTPYGLASPAALGANWAGRGLAYDGLAGCGGYAPALEFTATSGGALPVSSATAMAPVGISVASDNAYEGALAVAGELPFVGTVGLEGLLPTTGAGAVNHACGNGRNVMISETTAFGPGAYGAYGAYGPAVAIAPAALASTGLGYSAGWAGRGCGCA